MSLIDAEDEKSLEEEEPEKFREGVYAEVSYMLVQTTMRVGCLN